MNSDLWQSLKHSCGFSCSALAAYAATGLLFASIFVFRGVQQVDSEARGSGIGFRLLILPGVAGLLAHVSTPLDSRHRASN